MDSVEKALNKLSQKEKQRVKEILLQVDKGGFQGLDAKKLRGRENIFRVRKGDIRIIFRKIDNLIKILAIERRGSKAYRKK